MHLLTDVSEIGIPTSPVLRGTVQLRLNIGPAGGCQHCEAFSKSSNPLHRLPHICGRRTHLVGCFYQAGQPGVIELVGDCVLELFLCDARIEVKENGWIRCQFVHEAIAARFDHYVSGGAETRV